MISKLEFYSQPSLSTNIFKYARTLKVYLPRSVSQAATVAAPHKNKRRNQEKRRQRIEAMRDSVWEGVK